MKNEGKFLLHLINHLEMGIFVLDAEGNYVFVNQTYCDFLSKTPTFFKNHSIPKLKNTGFLSKSVWEQVVEKKASVKSLMTIVDKTNGKTMKHFTTAIPTFNIDGSIYLIYYLVEPLEKMTARIQMGMLNRQEFISEDLYPKTDIDFIAESPQMKRIIATLENIASTDASILITGPTGSGKEVVAHYAHSISQRRHCNFVSVDCAAIPENLLESELFGYEKGAFTGASANGKTGLIESADGDSLFLDELNSLPLNLQAKLLRVLETKKIKRLGANNYRSIDFRLICATNEELDLMVEVGAFRSDLYYRINVVPIFIPPLRDRHEDILPLTIHFLNHFCRKYARIKVLSETMIQQILEYEWRGNVRELKNYIERLVVTSPETDIEIDKSLKKAFDADKTRSESAHSTFINVPSPNYRDLDFSYHAYIDQCEKALLQDLVQNGYMPKEISKILQLDLSNVYRKMKKHGVHC